MAKIFISHSSEDQEMVRSFADFLQRGMGVSRTDIFCTSYPSALLTGEPFIERIKSQMADCEAVIFLFTERYLESSFCLAEMGAAWGLGKRIFPLLLVELERLERTPLKGVQVRRLDREEDISAVYDEFCNCGIIPGRNTAEYMREVPKFIRQVETIAKGEYLLTPQADGYYHTEIMEERQHLPQEYRCYKIKGHTEDWKSEDAAKTDWIFFRAGVYPDCRVGDKIRFKIHKTEVKDWRDIGKAKDIYPAELKIDKK